MNKAITPPDCNSGVSEPKRFTGLDLIRCFAVLFVIGSHFFLHSWFNTSPLDSVSMWIQGMLQTLMLINVPLFLLLTGYLNLNKAINRKYYTGLWRVLLSYLFFSAVTIIVRRYALHDDISWAGWILKITDFSAIPYAWYIEMWIGLFLLTPFLNILWKNTPSRKHRQILIATLFLLTALPDFFNRYGVHLVPGYWEVIYPVTFFYIGAYIREYRPEIKLWKGLCIIALLCSINVTVSAVFRPGQPMLHLIGDGNGVVGVPLATIFFLLCYKIEFSTGSRLAAKISRLSLDMYLVSYLFDAIFYPFFKQHVVNTQSEFGCWYVAVVMAVFIFSAVAAEVKTVLFKTLRLPT